MKWGDIIFRKKSNSAHIDIFEHVGEWAVCAWQHLGAVVHFISDIFGSLWKTIIGHTSCRRIDLGCELDKAGLRALPIVCLLSFMIGMIMAFVGNMQLKIFGAEIYVATLVAVSMVRIMGAMMTGIIMAGRTGAAYAAEIGSMRVNQEIDALRTMGISPTEFLVLPRVIALTVAMPVLTIVADIVAIIGGLCVAMTIMNISIVEYWHMTLDGISFNNFAVGVFHGWLFGWVIAITGCWCGMHAERTADGIGRATTRAVVAGIVGCIVTTAILTVIFNWIDI